MTDILPGTQDVVKDIIEPSSWWCEAGVNHPTLPIMVGVGTEGSGDPL